QLDAVAVRIADEAKPRAALADGVRWPLRLDPLHREPLERPVKVVDADRDVAIARAELVRAPVVVIGQLEHRLLVAEREEVVRRLQLSVADDVEVAGEREAERLVERAAARRVGDAVHRVQKGGHPGDRTRAPKDGGYGPAALRCQFLATELCRRRCSDQARRQMGTYRGQSCRRGSARGTA